MIVVSLCVEVLELNVADAQVQAAVHSVLELCGEMSHEPVNLVWPLMTAGSCVTSEEDRNWVRQLFVTFGSDYCKDLEIAVSHTRQDEANPSRTCYFRNNGHGWTVEESSLAGQRL